MQQISRRTTQTLTTVQQENSQDAASITAVLNQVRFHDCGGGKYELQALANIKTSVNLTADFAGSSFDFAGNTLNSWAPATGDEEYGLVTWTTACNDICDPNQIDLVIVHNHKH